MEFFFHSTINLSYLFLSVAMIIGILKYKALFSYEKWYFFYLIYTSLIEISVNIWVELLNAKETNSIYPFYIGGVFSILTFLFIRKLNFPKLWSMIIPILGILYIIFQFFFNEFNHDYVKVISNIIIFILAGISLLQEIKKSHSDHRFVVVDALIFLYYAVSAFIFIIHNQLGNMSIDNAYIIWGINNLLTCVLYLSFTYTFLKLKK